MENNSLFMKCQCGCHAIEIIKDEYEDIEDYDINFWYVNLSENWGFIKRLKAALEVLWHGKYMYYDLILTKDEAKKLGAKLIWLTNRFKQSEQIYSVQHDEE